MILVFALFMMAQHSQHVDARHDTFGMSHEATHHNFRLFADGGAIELRANDPADAATIGIIRTHIRHIAAALAKNDFSMPLFVHGHEPNGTATMKRLQSRISYRYEDVDAGGRVRVTTTDPKALSAVHDFMKFQIEEHRTGDRGEVEMDR